MSPPRQYFLLIKYQLAVVNILRRQRLRLKLQVLLRLVKKLKLLTCQR